MIPNDNIGDELAKEGCFNAKAVVRCKVGIVRSEKSGEVRVIAEERQDVVTLGEFRACGEQRIKRIKVNLARRHIKAPGRQTSCRRSIRHARGCARWPAARCPRQQPAPLAPGGR